MEYKNIIYEKDRSIAKITLNRPEKMNPLDLKVTLPMSMKNMIFIRVFDM